MTDFDWNRFLSLADELARSPAPEEKLRSAISRAYYACFHAGRIYIRNHYPDVRFHRTGVDHETVWESLKQPERKPEEKSAGVDGSRLLLLRGKADYDSCLPNVEWEAANALRMATKIIAKLRVGPSGQTSG